MAALSAAIAAVAVGAGIVGQRAASRKGAQAGRRQERAVATAQAEQAFGEQQAESIKGRDLSRQRQRQRALSASGRGSTILTGPLGVVGESAGAGRTLLGQ
jgi:hypothetical protein